MYCNVNVECLFLVHYSRLLEISKFMFTISKTLFIVPTDTHYYKIIEMLKQYKNYNTCSDMFRFTQERSSGAVLCLAKTTECFFPCSSVETQSILWWHISLLCRRTAPPFFLFRIKKPRILRALLLEL
jgi:hypothetical protein